MYILVSSLHMYTFCFWLRVLDEADLTQLFSLNDGLNPTTTYLAYTQRHIMRLSV